MNNMNQDFKPNWTSVLEEISEIALDDGFQYFHTDTSFESAEVGEISPSEFSDLTLTKAIIDEARFKNKYQNGGYSDFFIRTLERAVTQMETVK